jgi:purine-binding chemotaxis protein CheW
MSDPPSNLNSFCTFRIGNLYWGIKVSRVQEVIRNQSMTSVPLAPNTVAGLMNLRGQIVTAIDLATLLGLAHEDKTGSKMNVVVRSSDGPVSLLVDEIGDVVEVGEEFFEQAPETVQGPHRDFIEGAMKLNNRLLLLLDTQRVLSLQAA